MSSNSEAVSASNETVKDENEVKNSAEKRSHDSNAGKTSFCCITTFESISTPRTD